MKKRTIRKVYALCNPIQHAMYQASKLSTAEWNEQIIPVRVAIDALSRGEWTPDNWQPIFESLNRIESLIKLNHVDVGEWICEAQNAMVRALDRRKATGATAFRADELANLREVCTVYGDLLSECSHLQFANACRHTNANVSRILSNKPKMYETEDCVFERVAA